ncbi:MAG: glycosyltransferase [Candidatus Margulisiibacteriota bacterium]
MRGYPQGNSTARNPLISIVLPVFNRETRLINTIESVIQQSFQDFELIIVDDGSNDSSVRIAEAYQKSYPQKIRYFIQKNRGVSSARNVGIKRARGVYLAFIDSDDLWIKSKLEKQVTKMRTLGWEVSQTEEQWVRNGKKVNAMKKHTKRSGRIFYDCLPLCLVSPSAVMIKRAVFEKIGQFDEKLLVTEDYDLWLRISLHYPIYLISEKLVVKYGGHSDQLSHKYSSMDVFRIYAMRKLLRISWGQLDSLKKAALYWWIKEKANIVATGALKRRKWFVFLQHKMIFLWYNASWQWL